MPFAALLSVLFACMRSTLIGPQPCGAADAFKHVSSGIVLPFTDKQVDTSGGLLFAYRVLRVSSNERQCRFEPTCSQFFMHALKQHGFMTALLYASARMQLQHDSQNHFLTPARAPDGAWVYLDGAHTWP